MQSTNKSQVIHVNDIEPLLGKINLIDIREPYEYERGSMLTATNIPMGDLLDNPAKYMDKDNTYHIMCQSGGRSAMACQMLAASGYQVIDVAGGFGSYVGTKKK